MGRVSPPSDHPKFFHVVVAGKKRQQVLVCMCLETSVFIRPAHATMGKANHLAKPDGCGGEVNFSS